MIVKVSPSELKNVFHALDEEGFDFLHPLIFYTDYVFLHSSSRDTAIFICSQATTVRSSGGGENCQGNFIKIDSQVNLHTISTTVCFDF